MHARLSLVILLLSGLPAVAQDHEHANPAPEKLGTVHFATSCAPAVQPQLDRAVALLHSFAFPQAVARFEAVLAADPGCAMAEWGIALCRWGNPFAAGIKPPAQLERGREATRRARRIGAKTERERAWIEAAAQLYADFEETDQRTRLLAYESAMRALAASHPDDREAQVFYALSLAVAADPADKTYARQLEAGAILEKLFALEPEHPGLAHYIIHSYDVPALAPRALAAARRYATIAPSAPHALHMPSHTFTRLGLWQESIDTNIASAEAARRDASVAEELHASDYQAYAYLQSGQDGAARRLLDALPEIWSRFDAAATGGGAPPVAGFFAHAALPARWALERGAWAEAARLQPTDTACPHCDAITHFARGLGAARSGDAATARTAVAALVALRDKLTAAGESYWAGQVDVQRHGVAAWLALAEGRRDEAVAEMGTAATLEDATEKNAVTPGPLAPARELLGEMLLELGKPDAALIELEAALKHEPHRFRSEYDAARAALLANQKERAGEHYRTLLKTCERADTPGRAELQEARQYLSH